MKELKTSLEEMIKNAGFKQTGMENGTPVYTLKDLNEDQIDREDELFFDYKD